MRKRIKKNQKYFIKKYNNIFNIKNINTKINLSKEFNNKNKISLEIGFGNASYLIKNSLKNININYLGIDNYLLGINNLLKNIINFNIKNIRYINSKIENILYKNILFKNSINEINIIFPDPWEKNKHKKRRFINIFFLKEIIDILTKNGKLHIITDSKDYFHNILKNIFILININKNIFYIENIICYNKNYINTVFEIKAINNNNNIYYIIIIKN